MGQSLNQNTCSSTTLAVPVTPYTKQNPFSARLSKSLKITGGDSVKDIRHIEISLKGSDISYQAGDTLGVFFLNSSDVVERIIRATQNHPSDLVEINDIIYPLSLALLEQLELTLSYPSFIKAYQKASDNQALAAVLKDGSGLRLFLAARQIVDIIEQFPENISAQELVNALRPLTPRLYSISSSPLRAESDVHLTIAHVNYEAFGFQHQGGASGFLCSRLETGGEVKVYVENNDSFRLPSDGNTPVIMVGPGTGIAPFRAFMQEREVKNAKGKNWLFFGNPNYTEDFLYQSEWQALLASGRLSKISLAFSRDQADKVYVQDKMLENGKELFQWLEAGAHFYICGDATKMAKGVEAALLQIIEKFGNKSPVEAKQYLLQLRKTRRYQKDVY
jgi:sulfite reductase (NADPH) flavoprotein alpha-component